MNDYLKHSIIPWEMIGLETSMIPFFNFIATQRAAMASKNAQQWIGLKGSEFPRFFSGVETMYGDYTFDRLIVDRNVIVIKVINKYGRYVDDQEVVNNGMYTVICEDVETKEIGFFQISSYRFLSRGFGYFTKPHNHFMLEKGSLIPKGTMFQSSPAVDDNLYKMGVNANVIFLPLLPTSEDACIICDSLSKKMTYTQFYKFVIRVKDNMVPCSIFGTEDGEHKFMLDIGERIGPDGLLAALRPAKYVGVLKDYTEKSLKTYHPIYDEPFRCTPGAKVVDIDVFTNPRKWKEIRDPKSPYCQIAKYQKQLYNYYDEIAAVYEEDPTRKFSPKLTSMLVKNALMKPGKSHGRPNEICFSNDQPIFDGENPIDIAYIEVTVAVEKKAEIGSKITGRDGSKGVISAIWPDEWMPTDAWGFRADLIMNSNAVIDRMNISQLFEQFFTRLGDLVVMDTKDLPPDITYDLFMKYLYDYDPDYQKKVYEATCNDKIEWIKEVRRRGFHYNIPGTKDHFGMDHTLAMAAKWKWRTSKVVYTYPLDQDGNTKTVTSYEPEAIGSKYLFLINKIPTCNAVEIGYISQMGLAIKNPAAKARYIAQTAIRFGEDETRTIIMDIGAEETCRLINVSGNSFEDCKELVRRSLLSVNPFLYGQLPYSNDIIAKRSISNKILTHLMLPAGIDLSPEAVFRKENTICFS